LNFVVRSTNRVFERTVLTESDGQALDWMMKIVQQYRVPIEEFAAAVQGIERKPMKPRDAVWQAWQLLLSQKKWEIYHDAIYRDMATFAYEEKRNWRPYLELAVQANLNRALQASSSGVEIENLARIETCSACSADVGKKFSRREVLGKKPLPHLDCECELRSGFVGICQCTYESLLDF
jgi:hypothetical protein